MGTQLTPRRAKAPADVAAVVVTHRRPRLATTVVRHLLDAEGVRPERVVVVVNGEGGLEDRSLEASVRTVRLEDNTGPAGGFRRGLLEAFADPAVEWAYLCEDDSALVGLPAPRLGDLLRRVATRCDERPVGAVVALGRVFAGTPGHTRSFVPRRDEPGGLAPVDVGVWAATLVSRQVVEAGVLPDPELFFGFEDFDFFCSVRAAGFSVLVDAVASRRAAGYQTLGGRDRSLGAERPLDDEEPWRAYYVARNFFALAQRHGRRSWLAWHLLYSLRRLQRASGAAERLAIVRGLADGARGRLGAHVRYRRRVGERDAEAAGSSPGGGDVAAVPMVRPATELAARTLAMVVSHNAPGALARCLAAVAGQSVPPEAVLVVDNGSSPPVDVAACAPAGMALRVVRSGANTGPAGGWAIAFDAFRAGDHELAWVLDDDMVPDPDCLEVLLDAAAPDPGQAFFFPRAVQPDGSVGEWGSWCGFVVSRRIVEEVGVPRAELFWWAEDNEYTHWRIPEAGWPRRLVDGAVVQHDAVRQHGPVPTWKYYYEARNMLYLHLHLMRRVGWYPKNLLKLVARAVVRERGRRMRSVAAIVRGLADGVRGRLGVRFPIADMHERAGPSPARDEPSPRREVAATGARR